MRPIGEVVQLPRDSTYARVMPLIGVGLAVFFGIPAALLGPLTTNGLPAALAAMACAALAVGLRVVLNRTHRLVFTTQGIWKPKLNADGTFIRWDEIHVVRVDRNFLVLEGVADTVRVHLHSFKDPYAVNRLVRKHVPDTIAGHLDLEGEV